jgi:DNA-binding NarL/FixJ family response regulator
MANRIYRGISPAERPVLDLMAYGLTDKEIARTLLLAEGTVKNHAKSILRKMEAKNRTHAVAKFLSPHLFGKKGLP